MARPPRGNLAPTPWNGDNVRQPAASKRDSGSSASNGRNGGQGAASKAMPRGVESESPSRRRPQQLAQQQQSDGGNKSWQQQTNTQRKNKDATKQQKSMKKKSDNAIQRPIAPGLYVASY
jgi:hypothetical protein